jgi:hypothetical protein
MKLSIPLIPNMPSDTILNPQSSLKTYLPDINFNELPHLLLSLPSSHFSRGFPCKTSVCIPYLPSFPAYHSHLDFISPLNKFFFLFHGILSKLEMLRIE